ncbi:MAG: hypothetical protein ACOCUP_03380 [bacterium]
MKQKTKILIFIFIFLPVITFGQRKTASISLKSGYGYYQGIHLGAGYFYDKDYNIGISIGSDFGLPSLSYATLYNISIENTIHFGWRQKFISKPWIFGQQAMYWVEGYDPVKWRILSASMTMGRVFGITHNLGIAFEAGPAYNMIIDVVGAPDGMVESWMWPVMFNGRVQLVYSFR